MSKREDKVYLKDILESILLIEEYVFEKTEFEYAKDVLTQDAVNRRFEIIGEAATRISDGFRNKHPEIEWNLMKAMRNKLSHEYFGISTTTIFQTIKTNLPTLKEKIRNVIT